MAPGYQGQRATHWSTHLFLDTGDYPAIKDDAEPESEFEDWRAQNTIMAIIHCLASMVFLLICLGLGLDFSGFMDVALSFFLSFPITMFTGWLDPVHGEIVGLILLLTVQLAIWTDFFVRTVVIDKFSRWPLCLVGTALLLFIFANLLRVVHWYWRRFLGLGMHRADRQVGPEIDEDALPEPYSDENALVPPHGDEDGPSESYSDGLLGLAYREQLEASGQQPDTSKMGKPGDNDTDEEDHDSQMQPYHDTEEPPPASVVRAQSPVLTEDYGEGPSALPISPPLSQQDFSLQTRQQESHFKPLSFQPRFRWQENVPNRFHKSLASLSLCCGICYLGAEAASLSMGKHYCKMNIPL